MTLAIPLVFAARLLSVLVAVSASLVLLREEGRGALARTMGGLGFLAIAAAEAWLGFSIGAEVPAVGGWLRVAGYALLLLSALPAARRPAPAAALPALAVLPGRPVLPGGVAAAAAVALGWRRRGEPGGVALAAGLLLLGIADTMVHLREEVSWAGVAAPAIRVAAYLFVVRFVLALTRRRIRFRILAGFFGLLLAVIVAVSSVVAQVISENLRQAARVRVGGQAEAAQREFLRRAQDAALRVAAIAGAPSTAETFVAGQSLDPLARDLLGVFVDVDFVVFLDHRLRLLGNAGARPVEALAVAGSEVSRSAADGVEAASLEGLERGGMAVLGANPVQLRGEVVGVVVAGFQVDSGLLERSVPQGTPVAVYRGFGDVPVAATFPGWRRGTGLLPPGVLARARELTVRLDRPVVERITAEDRRYFAAFGALRSELGVPVGTLVVGEPAAVLGATQRAVTRVLFLVALAAAALALLLALLAARRITGPVVALTGAARRVQAGDLQAKASVRGEDEVADLAGAFNRMTDSVHDMTGELREAAAEQARLRGRLETVLNSMGDGLVAVDEEGVVVTCNPTASELLGASRGEVLGRPLGEAIRGRDPDGGDLLSEGAMRPGLGFLERADGREVPVAISSAPLRDGRGREAGTVYVLRDMTREHEVERMKGEFLSNVSHELRTPLTPIIGYSELMSKRDVSEGQAREFAGGILDSARRLERIVAMLVDFSAMEGGRMPLSLSEVRVPDLVEGALGEWRDRTDRHRFETRFQPDLPPAQADLSLLRKVLDELLDNAVKYSPEGGRVAVAVAGENNLRKRMISVEIADQGIGIEPENMARIFQDFRQVDASDTRAFGGLGLGLAFVKRIVEAHGGTIDADSQPGRGATFRFTVPTADTGDGAA